LWDDQRVLIRRLFLLLACCVLALTALGARLAQLQLGQAQRWRDEAQLFIRRHQVIETSRGTIYDVRGHVIAQDEGCYDLAIDYRAMNLDDRWITQVARTRMTADGITGRQDRTAHLPEYKRKIADQIDATPTLLARLCGLSDEDIQERFNAIRERMQALRQLRVGKTYDPSHDDETSDDSLEDGGEIKEQLLAHTVIPAVPDQVAFYIDKHLDEFPGLVRVAAKRRVYPYGAVAAHVIGALRPVDANQLAAHRFARPNLYDDTPGDLTGYLPGDNLGAFGIEKLAEKSLRGTRGVRLVDLDGVPIDGKVAEPTTGGDVHCTLDLDLQRDVQTALLDPNRHLCRGQDGDDHPVALVILNASDSSVLAILSLPTYDLNLYQQNIGELMKDNVNLPLQNRAIAAAYPPGSTVKPLLAAGGLTDGVITPSDIVVCNGYLFPNHPNSYRCDIYVEHPGATHGPLDLAGALERSCNIYFYTLGMKLGYERLCHWYGAFGLGEKTGIGLSAESEGAAPTLAGLPDPEGRKLEAILLGIGQGHISATPLQMANAYATLLRGGVRMTPRVIAEQSAGATSDLHIDPANLQAIKDGLYAVVNGAHGTARRIRMNVDLAGKTGSATATRPVWIDGKKSSRTDSDAWFMGYVPADHPQYVIAALMEFGGHGGVAAAPMAREAVYQLERHGYLPQLDDDATITIGSTP
jgi:penicillin-binding protein 2